MNNDNHHRFFCCCSTILREFGGDQNTPRPCWSKPATHIAVREWYISSSNCDCPPLDHTIWHSACNASCSTWAVAVILYIQVNVIFWSHSKPIRSLWEIYQMFWKVTGLLRYHCQARSILLFLQQEMITYNTNSTLFSYHLSDFIFHNYHPIQSDVN